MNAPHEFSHVKNQQPSMVDISHKSKSLRLAHARSRVCMPAHLSQELDDGDELFTKKGPVFATAIIAGTMAVKNTSTLIPFCHPLPIDHIDIRLKVMGPGELWIDCIVKTFGATGVEMEALTGASITALTLYDMCKSLSLDLRIAETFLVKKSGGKSEYESSRRGQ